MAGFPLPPDLATEMPCEPQAIRPCYRFDYAMPMTLGSMELEEAAARLLIDSLQSNVWTGISWAQMVEQMKADMALYDNMPRRAQRKLDEAYEAACQKRFWLTVVTLGLYALFVPPPVRAIAEQPKDQRQPPLTGIMMQGPDFVGQGLRGLADRGYMKIVEEGDGAIFYPTPALVRFLQPFCNPSPA